MSWGFVGPSAGGWQPGRVRGGGGAEGAAAALIVARPNVTIWIAAGVTLRRDHEVYDGTITVVTV